MRGRPLDKRPRGPLRSEGATSGMPCGASGLLLGRFAGRGGLLRGRIRASSRRSRAHISAISIHERPIIEKKGLCAVDPRVAATCRPSGSAVPASREKLSISPRHWFGCGIERGLSCPACETRDGRCASFRLILRQEETKWRNGKSCQMNERSGSDCVARWRSGDERVARQGPKRVILLVRRLGVQNARARQKS